MYQGCFLWMESLSNLERASDCVLGLNSSDTESHATWLATGCHAQSIGGESTAELCVLCCNLCQQGPSPCSRPSLYEQWIPVGICGLCPPQCGIQLVTGCKYV